MKKIAEIIEKLYHTSIDYLKTNAELYRLKALDKFSDVLSTLGATVIIVVVFLLFLAIISIGLAVWIGDMLGTMYYGFFIVGGFYGLLFFILLLFRKKLLKRPITNAVVHHLTK